MRFSSPKELDRLVNEARELPGIVKLAGNLGKAVVKHAKNKFKKVSVDKYKERLDICNGCPLRRKDRCTHIECGCFIAKKAWWESESCPVEKW